MKILAIRGQGLTSFAEPFTVDLESDPIRSAGIFAIVGPTGAGKSTLLDAICLALYDELPRMDTAEGGARVGRTDDGEGAQVGYADVKSILRHGAGSGYAEVDFIGQDGGRYRATWRVRRARERADGTIQDQRMELRCLATDTIIGDRKTEVLREIEKRIGLDFKNFRRAVMLTQGAFDEFISAKSRDRAELLERITGTEIYGKLSKRAFARAKIAREAVDQVKRQIGASPCLDPDARAAADALVDQARAGLSAVDATRRRLAEAAAWYQELSLREASVLAGENAYRGACAIDAAASKARRTLADILAGLELRAEFKAFKDAEGAAALASGNATEAETNAQAAAAAAAALAEIGKAAQQQLSAAKLAHAEALPQVIGAEKLDERIEVAAHDVNDARQENEKAAAALQVAVSALTAAEVNVVQQTGKLDSLRQWLSENENLRLVAANIEELTDDLRRLQGLESDKQTLAENLGDLETAASAADQAAIDATTSLETQLQEERDLQQTIAELDGEGLAARLPLLETRVQQAATTVRLLEQTALISTEARSAHHELEAANDEAAAAKHRAQQSATTISETDVELPVARAQASEARRAQLALDTMSSEAAAALRATLQDGEPCAVCGALDHPFAALDASLAEQARAARERLANLENEVQSLAERAANAAAIASEAEAALVAIVKRQQVAERRLQEAQKSWVHSGPALKKIWNGANWPSLELLADVTLEACSNALEAAGKLAVSELQAETAALSDARRERESLQLQVQARERLRVVIDGLRTTSEKALEAQRASQSAVAARRIELSTITNQCVELDGLLARSLDVVLPDWRTVDDALAECRALVTHWQDRQKEARSAEAEIARISTEFEEARKAQAPLQAAATTQATRLADRIRAFDDLSAKRTLLLDGRSASDVRTQIDELLAGAQAAAEDAGAKAAAASTKVAAAQSTLAAAREAAGQAVDKRETTSQALTKAAELKGLTIDAISAAVALGRAHADAEQLRLSKLAQDVGEAAARLSERQAALEEHRAKGQPESTPEAVAVDLENSVSALNQARDQLAAAQAAVLRDDAARTSIAALTAQLEEVEAAGRVWRELDELIGSHDGSKFRRFAQSLTLDHLVRLANRHLIELCPRYELQRVPGAELMLQVVDQDMAGEVRGVHSLSGGEKFLVSLALALGLAGMSSGRGLKVGSLFIDEGFGSLDSASLAMAVSVLERLQASGRQIGLISHVAELRERIQVKVEVEPVQQGRSCVRVYAD